jgi:hypothetical protein
MLKRITRIMASLMVVAMLLMACGCSANSEIRASGLADDVVATAGTYEIPYENLYFLAQNQIADMKAVYGENVFDDPAKVAELKAFVEKNLFGYTEAMIMVGKDYGIEVDDDGIADRVQDEIDRMMTNQLENDRDAYIKLLNERYMTDHYFRTYVGVSEFLVDDILQVMLRSGEIDNSDAAARDRIWGEDENGKAYFAHVYQVFIDPHFLLEDDAAARQKAETLRERVVAASDRMDAMRTAIQSSHATDDGNGLYIARGEMDAEFDRAAFSMDENYGVSEVMYLNGGYCFLMRAPMDTDYVSQHFEELKQKSYYVYLNQKAEAYMTGSELTWTEDGLELDLLDLPELEADGGEWVKTLVALLIVGAVVGAIALLVVFLPDKDNKKKKAKKKT